MNTIAGWLGVTSYPPAVLFAVATLFILAVLLHYSTVISKLADQNVILAQRLALLEQHVGDDTSKEAASTPGVRHEPRSVGGLTTKTSPPVGSSIQLAPTPMR